MTERVLYSAFITFGEIVEVQIPRDPSSRTSLHRHGGLPLAAHRITQGFVWLSAVKTRGFGFVEFEDASDAADAVSNMDGTAVLPLCAWCRLVTLVSSCAECEFYGRVLTVNYARPLQNKLGTQRPVWDDVDEYSKLKEQIAAGEVPKLPGPLPVPGDAEPDVDE